MTGPVLEPHRRRALERRVAQVAHVETARPVALPPAARSTPVDLEPPTRPMWTPRAPLVDPPRPRRWNRQRIAVRVALAAAGLFVLGLYTLAIGGGLGWW